MKMLLIVDMLNDFCDPKGKLYIGKQVIECTNNIKNVLKKFRQEKDGVIFLSDAHNENDKEFNLFPAHCVIGTHGECVVEELEPQNDEIIFDKQTYSGAYNNQPLIDEIYENLAHNEVYICGLCTSICVMETVADLYKEGITCKVIENACCDIDNESHEMGINRMKLLFGAEIV